MNFLMFFFLATFGVLGLLGVASQEHGAKRDSLIATCSFALMAAAAYLVDTVMAIINYKK